MTRQEMIEAMEIACDGFRECSGTEDGNCPFCDRSPCPCIESAVFTDKEIEAAYNLMFNENNPVSHPSHYTQGSIECIDAMVAAFGEEAVATWCKLNAFKYLWRERHKNGIQDMDKARWYLTKYMEFFKKE